MKGPNALSAAIRWPKFPIKEPKRLYPRNNRQAGVLDQFVANIIKAPQKVQATQPCNKTPEAFALCGFGGKL